MRERVRRVKERKLGGWDKDNLIGKAEVTHANKANQRIHSLVLTGRQVFSHLQESRAPSCIMVTREDKHHNSEHPQLPSSSLSFICRAWCLNGVEYPFGQWGSAVLAVSLLNFLCTPSLLAGGVAWEAEKALTLCKSCSAITKPPRVDNHKFKT